MALAMNYVALTPYLVPGHLPKRVNAGDGFVLGACEKLIGHKAAAQLSSWAPLGDADIEAINQHDFLLVAGTNKLKDDFVICPGFTAETMSRIKVPVVLMGMGHYGHDAVTQGLQPHSVKLFEAILERFPFVSARCDTSTAYLRQSLARHHDAILMTSCPAGYSVDGLDKGFVRKPQYDCLAVTITDRTELQQQLPILAQAPALFPSARRVLVLHQDYQNSDLHAFAHELGYEVFASPAYEDYVNLYRACDVHFGNRVHAHLKCLSMGNVSFVTPFDLRQKYFAQSLDFPVIKDAASPEIAAYDFGRYKKRIAAATPAMHKFVAALPGASRE